MGPRSVEGLSPQFRVVCLGGSSGALRACIDILQRFRADSGIAFVVVMHREKQYASLLPRILASSTDMPVIDVEDGMRVLPGHVFIAPPVMELTLDGEIFHVAAAEKRRGWPTTISVFLRSLAQSAGPRAIAVILSGKDHDGSSAVSEVRAAGGLNLAQADARSPDMPAAAVGTGCVDFYLTSAEIGEKLLTVGR